MSDDRERIDDLARRLDAVPRAFLAIALAIATNQLWRLSRGATDAVGVAIPLVVAAAWFGVLRLRPLRRVGILVVVVPLAVLLLAADLIAGALDWNANRNVDDRTMAQAVFDLRAAGDPDAVPVSRAAAYLEEPLRVDGIPTVPLSGLPNAREVLCREAQPWRAYATDRMGFENPDSVWDAPADLVLIGDSYTQGFCVDERESFAGRIRARFPATVNLGGGANGPLAELGTAVEFLPRARPQLVLWFFYETNDLDDVLTESRQSVLASYLRPHASQQLVDRMPAVHAAQRASVERKLRRDRPPEAPSAWAQVVRVIRLGHLRQRLGWIRRAPHAYEVIDAPAVSALFPKVAQRMREEADAVGAELVMVYLPGRDALDGVGVHPLRPMVLESARAAGIPVIDLVERFRAHGEPDRLYVSPRVSAHLTPRGNQLVADEVLDAVLREVWLAPRR